MQELRLVAVSEDGTYLVLATAGRGTRFTLPVDDRLRAAVRGHFSRLGQFEIEVESPLRPKEIQARIRSGETAEEIAESAGIPVERVRWFEGPVLQEREYMAQQAQRVAVRRPGETTPGPPLGETVEERLGRGGVDLEEVEWDAWKCEDSTWRIRLSFFDSGRPHAAEWVFDPRRRHVSPLDEIAARLTAMEWEDDESLSDTVTPLVPRRPAMKVVADPERPDPRLRVPEPQRIPEPQRAPEPLRAAEPREYIIERGRMIDTRPAFRDPGPAAVREAAPAPEPETETETAWEDSWEDEAPAEAVEHIEAEPTPEPAAVPAPEPAPVPTFEAAAPQEDVRPEETAEDAVTEEDEEPPAEIAAEDDLQAEAAAPEQVEQVEQVPAPAGPEPSEEPRAEEAAAGAAPARQAPARKAPAQERPVQDPAAAGPADEEPAGERPADDPPVRTRADQNQSAEPAAAEPAVETAEEPEERPVEPAAAAEQPQPVPPQRPARREPVRPPAKKKPAARPTMPAAPVAAPQEKPAPAAAAAAAATEAPAAQRPARGRRKAKGKRASVPSWDEIMFGARRPE